MEYKFTSMDEFDWSILNRTHSGKWVDIVREFLESKQELCVITCKDTKERNVGIADIRDFLKRSKVDGYVVGAYGPYRFYITNGKQKNKGV